MQTRRSVLAGMAAASLSPAVSWAKVGAPAALSAVRDARGRYGLVGLDQGGSITFTLPLPGRGHAAAAHPTDAEAVAIARRPGTFALVIDCRTGRVRRELHAPQGRHFYGHAAFSENGHWLFTTENDFSSGSGRIGVWDRSGGYERIHEFSSHGIGPHEIIRLPDGALAVANGGIRTHPATGREKLNLETMRPNLSIISPDGALLDQAEPPPAAHMNSLRHIAVLGNGTIGCGFQWQGDPFAAPSLLATYTHKTGLAQVEMDEELLRKLDGYIGSIAATSDTTFAASSPRGGRIMVFSTENAILGAHHAGDACGLASLRQQGCLASDGNGNLHHLKGSKLTLAQSHAVSFDNHLISVGS